MDIRAWLVSAIRAAGSAWVLGSLLTACGGSSGNGASGESGVPQDTVQAQAVVSLDAVQDKGGSVVDLTDQVSFAMSDPAYGLPVQSPPAASVVKALGGYFKGRRASGAESVFAPVSSPAPSQKLDHSKASGDVPQAVYRFLNTVTGVHFYTMSEVEMQTVLATLPRFRLEGVGYHALAGRKSGATPIHRFYLWPTGTHFYTASEEEKEFVIAELSAYFTYEGVAWYGSAVSAPGWVPVYRFYNPLTGAHFYTRSDEERDDVLTNLSFMELDGVAYYVRQDAVPLPQSSLSGTGAYRCAEAGNDTSFAQCSSAGALALNQNQDGHLEQRPRIYGPVGAYPLTSCIQDQRTGLVWEVKARDVTTAGSRYTHWDDTTKPQVGVERIWPEVVGTRYVVPRNPTQEEVDSPGNSVAYVRHVNSIALCGFTDWRVPTSTELLGLASFTSSQLSLPSIFSSNYLVWTADPVSTPVSTIDAVGNPVVTDKNLAMRFDLFEGVLAPSDRGDFSWGGSTISATVAGLVLVRGASTTTERYSYTSIPYGRDQTNNVVVDNVTKVLWRRCPEGQVWSGSTCNGTPMMANTLMNLAHAQTRFGWRLPDIKELDSLMVRREAPALASIDTTAFPMVGFSVGAKRFASSTLKSGLERIDFIDPVTGWWDSRYRVTAFNADFSDGGVRTLAVQDELLYLRLVRNAP